MPFPYDDAWDGTNSEQGGGLTELEIGVTNIQGGTPGDILIVGPSGELEQQTPSSEGIRITIPAGTTFTMYVANYVGTIVGGSGGTNGTYNNVALSGGSGSGLHANIVISGNTVVSVAPIGQQSGYIVGDVLTASPGSVSGFSYTITAVGNDSQPISLSSGSLTSPFATIQAACDFLCDNFYVPSDGPFTNVSIQVVDGVYTSNSVNGFVLPNTSNLNTGPNLTGNSTYPRQTLLQTTGAFAVLWGQGLWGVQYFKLDASGDSNAAVHLVYVTGAVTPAYIFFYDLVLGQAGSGATPADQGYHVFVNDTSFVNLINTVEIDGTALGFLHVYGENSTNPSIAFDCTIFTLHVDPGWPGGTLSGLQFGQIVYTQSNPVTGTSSGPQFIIDPTSAFLLESALTTVPGSSSTNVINGPVYSQTGALLGWETAYTAADNSGTIVIKPPNSVTSWTMTLPTTGGTGGYVLSTNGSGVTSWIPAGGGGGALPTTEWDARKVGSHASLSGGNTTITGDGSGNFSATLSSNAHDSGKWYAEATWVTGLPVSSGGSCSFGIALSSINLNQYLGINALSWAYFGGYGNLYHNSANGPAVTTPVHGDVLQIAWDADTGNLFFGLNNVWQNAADPVAETNPCYTGILGILYVASNVSDTGQFVLNSPLVYSPPLGYTEWSTFDTVGLLPGGSTNSVQYNNVSNFGGASHFQITSGQPDVSAGYSYFLNGNAALSGISSASNYFIGGGGNFSMSGSANIAIGDTNTLLNNTSGGGNVAIGGNAMNANTAGNQSVAIGNNSLQFATGGSQNVAIGPFALQNFTSGTGNLAIGPNAMSGASSCNACTGIGSFALAANSGDNNNAIGSNALSANTSGINNNAVGSNALQSNTTGSNNSADGFGCLGSCTTGSGNSASGNSALGSLIDGTGNTGIGSSAGKGLVHGSSNICLGANTLEFNDVSNCIAIGSNALNICSGSDNTCIGDLAGSVVTTGAGNVLIGSASSIAGGVRVTSGSNNITIGFNVGVPTPTGSDQLNIANFIYGTGMYASSGLIGFGISGPTAVLHLAPSSTAAANLRFDPTSPAGPSSPNDGDMWYDGTNLKFRQGGTTHTIV